MLQQKASPKKRTKNSRVKCPCEEDGGTGTRDWTSFEDLKVNFDHISCVEDVCYIFVETPATWMVAGAVCQRYGGFLAEVKTPAQAAEMERFRKKVSDKHGVWLGGHDLGAEGQWRWQKSGDKIPLRGEAGFQKWTAGQPKDAGAQGENCMEQWSDHDGKHDGWNDAPCDMKLPSMCQRPK